jgi:protein gp37
MAYRFSGAGKPYEGLAVLKNGHASWTGKVALVDNHLLDPMKWKNPRRIFVNSMSDLFHPNVPDEWIDSIFAVMALCPQHTFQVLTKRPEEMLEYSSGCELRGLECLLPNVWLGVSDEGDQHQRIDILRQVPAAVRFISFEPLLFDPGIVNLKGISWVICGGESGKGARTMQHEWAADLRDQCIAAGVPYFFKQWGEHGSDGVRVGKKAAGCLLDGVEYHQFPK